MSLSAKPPVCLSISASDSTGVSFLQADLKTFTALGTYGVAVTTAILARGLRDTISIHCIPDGILRDQLQALSDALPLQVVKIGFLPSSGSARVVGRWLREHPKLHVVLDPILLSQPGVPSASPEVIQAMQQELLPRAAIITPNRYEAAQLTGMEEVLAVEDMAEAATKLFKTYGCPCVVTGGGLAYESLDVYCGMDGVSHFSAPAVKTNGRVLGAGCTYSAALAAQLARGAPIREALQATKSYVGALIHASPEMALQAGQGTILVHCLAVEHMAEADGVGISTGSFRALADPEASPG